MAIKKKSAPKKKDNIWIIVIACMILFIAGILYFDHSKNKANYVPSPSPIPVDDVSPQSSSPGEIMAALESKDPAVFYFYADNCSECFRVQPLIASLGMRLQSTNIKLILVKIDDNKDIADLFYIDKYPIIVVYKEQEIFRQTVSINDNPDRLLALIKEKLGIG